VRDAYFNHINRYEETKLDNGQLLVCYAAVPAPQALSPDTTTTSEVVEKPPFCCSKALPKDSIRLDQDNLFNGLFSSKGHFPSDVFAVVRKICWGLLDSLLVGSCFLCICYFFLLGDLISTKYFQVLNNQVVEITKPLKMQKVTAYRSYICKPHNRYFDVDLYTTRQTICAF
jgi:hypothetical protein